MKRLAVPALLLGLLIPASALAHQKSVSYSKWTLVDDGAIAEVRVRWLELTSLPLARDATPDAYERSGALPYLQTKLSLESDAGPCEAIPSSTTWLPAERGWLRLEWRVRCGAPPTSLHSQLFTSLTNHVHLATVLGPEPIDVVLSSTAPKAAIDATRRTVGARGIGSYVRLGVEHILSGWDHIAFLILLIVVARRVREVAILVTGFTVGHSVTLAAAALGIVVPHARAVEATIAASILLVALENVGVEQVRGGALVILGALVLFVASAAFGSLPAFWGLALFTACYFALLRTLRGVGRLRWLIACLFGFVHGLGFSGVLLGQELPRAQLVQALFGFNVGVELGQLAIVACIWPLLQWLRRRDFGMAIV
ncbi:MAG: HupE/UreJ family protein, partial [Deltaproteobacteria bacterium]|nr:HupE/UreJ family protein [Deltaproteobacteria bacterium]